MLTPVLQRNCQTCDKVLKGRTDKKFCDDYCRNAFNNQLNADTNNLVRKVNNTLRRNRRILEELMGSAEKEKRVHRAMLLESGFRFRYCTHVVTYEKGNCYTFCYDYGYAALDDDWYLLIREEKEEE